MYIYIYIYIYIYLFVSYFLFRWIPFIPSMNLGQVFTYNHMALMSFQCISHVKASMVLMRANHLFIHN